MGYMFKFGKGAKQSDTEAFRWLEKAAHQGHACAQFNFGMMFEKGDGVKQSYTEAFLWFEKAAHQGITKSSWEY